MKAALSEYFLKLSILANDVIRYRFDGHFKELDLPRWHGRDMIAQATYLFDNFEQDMLHGLFYETLYVASLYTPEHHEFDVLLDNLDALYYALTPENRPDQPPNFFASASLT